MVEEYVINSMTLMLKYIDENRTLVYEDDREIVVNLNIFDIVSGSCYFYGSTYNGRYLFSRSILNTNIKLPISVDFFNRLIVFPTRSYKNKSCIWIIYNNVKDFTKIRNGIELCFKNDKKFLIDVSFEIINRQIYNCLKLEKEIEERKKTYC